MSRNNRFIDIYHLLFNLLIIMLSTVIAIDPAIGLFLVIGGLINYRALSYYAKKLHEQKLERIRISKKLYEELTEDELDKYINKKINNKLTDSKAFTKQLLNALVIMSIMLLVFFRDGTSIGFIFIILMRLSLNNLNKGIETLVRYRMKIFDDPEDQIDFT